MVDGRDHKGVGDWLFARPPEWCPAVRVVAIDPWAAFRKALRMRLPRNAAAVDHFHLISLANQAMTETRQNLSQQVDGRRGRAIDKAWAHRLLTLCGGDTLSCRAALRLQEVVIVDDPRRPSSRLESQGTTPNMSPRLFSWDAATAKEVLKELVQTAARHEANWLYRTIGRWWKRD